MLRYDFRSVCLHQPAPEVLLECLRAAEERAGLAQEEVRQLHAAAVRLRSAMTGVVSRNKELHVLAAEQAARCDTMSEFARQRDDTIVALNEQARMSCLLPVFARMQLHVAAYSCR